MNTFCIKDTFTPAEKMLIIEKQRAFYAENYGFDETFLDYLLKTFDTEIEKIWIAKINGAFAGSIGLVEESPKVGQLRWFIVEPAFREKGLGSKLIQSLVDYCKTKDYDQIFLWTVSDLKDARRLYAKFGFQLADVTEEQFLWGQRIVEERWDLELNQVDLGKGVRT